MEEVIYEYVTVKRLFSKIEVCVQFKFFLFLFQKTGDSNGDGTCSDKPSSNLADQWEMFEKLVGESAFLPDDNATQEKIAKDTHIPEEEKKSESSENT